MQLTVAQQQTLMHVARGAIRAALGQNTLAFRGTDDPALQTPAGCFVTLHELGTHRLRGCIGRMDAGAPLIKGVAENAANALADPRFTNWPITAADLPTLELDLSVLSPMRQAATPMDFDLANEGIYLALGERTGVFLPQVARETGWTREQLLARLCSEKMGMAPDAWRHPQARLMAFTAMVIGPEGF